MLIGLSVQTNYGHSRGLESEMEVSHEQPSSWDTELREWVTNVQLPTLRKLMTGHGTKMTRLGLQHSTPSEEDKPQ